jgi:hypothetical protein
MREKAANPYLEINLPYDYDLLESAVCLCKQKKEMGKKMCEWCYRRLTTSQQVQLASMQPGDGIANAVGGLVRRS